MKNKIQNPQLPMDNNQTQNNQLFIFNSDSDASKLSNNSEGEILGTPYGSVCTIYCPKSRFLCALVYM